MIPSFFVEVFPSEMRFHRIQHLNKIYPMIILNKSRHNLKSKLFIKKLRHSPMEKQISE